MPPFEEDDSELEPIKNNLGKISKKQSIFDKSNKKQSASILQKAVQNIEDKNLSFKERTSALAIKFKKLIESKILPENKNLFLLEEEKEVLTNIASLASEIDNDENESVGIGSLSWIVQLLKTSLYQRDRINKLEYANLLLNKKIEELSAKVLQMASSQKKVDTTNDGG